MLFTLISAFQLFFDPVHHGIGFVDVGVHRESSRGVAHQQLNFFCRDVHLFQRAGVGVPEIMKMEFGREAELSFYAAPVS